MEVPFLTKEGSAELVLLKVRFLLEVPMVNFLKVHPFRCKLFFVYRRRYKSYRLKQYFVAFLCNSVCHIENICFWCTGLESYCLALYDYEATCPEELSFTEGKVIRVLRKVVHGVGELDGQIGLFPSLVVEECREDGEPLTPQVICTILDTIFHKNTHQ